MYDIIIIIIILPPREIHMCAWYKQCSFMYIPQLRVNTIINDTLVSIVLFVDTIYILSTRPDFKIYSISIHIVYRHMGSILYLNDNVTVLNIYKSRINHKHIV